MGQKAVWKKMHPGASPLGTLQFQATHNLTLLTFPAWSMTMVVGQPQMSYAFVIFSCSTVTIRMVRPFLLKNSAAFCGSSLSLFLSKRIGPAIVQDAAVVPDIGLTSWSRNSAGSAGLVICARRFSLSETTANNDRSITATDSYPIYCHLCLGYLTGLIDCQWHQLGCHFTYRHIQWTCSI